MKRHDIRYVLAINYIPKLLGKSEGNEIVDRMSLVGRPEFEGSVVGQTILQMGAGHVD
jgi:hypothetical protein